MKKYTHAWLAFMAIKRLEYADIPEKYTSDAKALVKWFRDYRDCVIDGSWYPDEVFKDMAASHVLKYMPSENGDSDFFSGLPETISMFNEGKQSPLYNRPYYITAGNLPDRCEAFSHSIVDSFKMLRTEDKGCPISPTGNHIAMRFFILSHYIVDAHMPLHCDSRPFSNGANIHGYIEGLWESQVKKSYSIDLDNERFFYDPEGYPLHSKTTALAEAVEEELIKRPFIYEWGKNNDNVWDYMQAITQFSYLNAYRLIPAEYDDTITKAQFKALPFGQNFDEYSLDIMSDTIESIARIWLHVWIKYRKWAKLSPLEG